MDTIRDGASTEGEERLKAVLYLSALLKLSAGSPTVRIFGKRGGCSAEAERLGIEVSLLWFVQSRKRRNMGIKLQLHLEQP